MFEMHRRDDLWGSDGTSSDFVLCCRRRMDSLFSEEEFDPDRFLDGRLKRYLAKNPFIFLLFLISHLLGQQVQPLSLFPLFRSTPMRVRPRRTVQHHGKKARVWLKMHLTMYVTLFYLRGRRVF